VARSLGLLLRLVGRPAWWRRCGVAAMQAEATGAAPAALRYECCFTSGDAARCENGSRALAGKLAKGGSSVAASSLPTVPILAHGKDFLATHPRQGVRRFACRHLTELPACPVF
ncbi:unnamed protein product, partial [Amoebophrya sp. A120]